MSDLRFEYMAVRVKKMSPSEEQYTQRLNDVAAHGWRLVGLSPAKDRNDMLVFERPVNA